MYTKEHLFSAVDKYRSLIFETESWLWQHPETGFREWESSSYLEKAFEKLGYALHKAGDIPGFYTDIDTGRPGPRILIFSELDSLLCSDHPDANPETYAVHACGHHAQSAALLGLAAVLKEPGALDGLSGSIRLCCVPAEELIETEYRESLRAQGVIRYMGGKVEFMRRGYFDGADMCFMIHASSADDADFILFRGNNGCVVKNVYYKGRATHASAPYQAVNALYAANLGMSAINSLRETFRDEDHIRVHPIITRGGTAVNAIPNDVRLQSYVRGASLDAIFEVNRRVNRALACTAAAMGAQVHLEDRPGYSPLHNDKNLIPIAAEAMEAVSPGKVRITDGWRDGSTDMGDMSAVMPTIYFYAAGAKGAAHGSDFRIADAERACVNSAKCQLMLLNLLLKDDAAAARKVIAERSPRYSSYADYFAAIDQITLDLDAVCVNGDKTISVSYGEQA